MTRTGMLLALLVAAALLAACDEADDAEPAEDPDDDAVAEEDLDEDDEDADEPAEEEPADEDEDDDDVEDADEPTDDVTIDPDLTLAIEYDIDVDEPGAAQALTVVQDGAERSSWWASTEQEEVGIIEEGGDTISCIDEGGGWQCFQAPDIAEEEDPLGLGFGGVVADDLVAEDVAEQGFEEVSEETVAGRDALCGEPTDELEENGGVLQVCLDRDTGAVLHLEDESGLRMEAVEAREPTDEDFEPPVEPEDLGM